MRRVVMLALVVLSVPTPAAAVIAFEVSGNIVVSKVETSRYPQISMIVAPPRLLAPRGLTPDMFAVTENDESRPVTVSRLPNSALQVALVLDPSVPPDVFRDAQGAVLDFVLELPAGTRVALIRAGEQPQVTLPSTPDLAAVTAALGDLTPGPGRTIYDAVIRADAELPPVDQARRAVLVFTGGDDTSSSAAPEAVGRQLTSTGTSLYAVALSDGGGGALASVADEAGGQSLEVEPNELVGAYQRVAEVLLNQYQVTFQARSQGRARVGIRVAADGFSGERSLAVQLTAADPASGSNAAVRSSDGGGGRAVVEPLAAGSTIVIALLAGGLLVALGRAGLRSRSTADELVAHDAHVAGTAKTTTLSR